MKCLSVLAFSLSFIFLSGLSQANAAANLFVSIEKSESETEFSGPMVVKVTVVDPDIAATDEPKVEPDVTVNGERFRMAQGSDGQWYGYFADAAAAQLSDAEGLDFGVFCSAATAAGVLGDVTSDGAALTFVDPDAVAIPRIGELDGWTNGTASFEPCTTGVPTSFVDLGEVIDEAPLLNTFSGLPDFSTGQIGIHVAVWPLVQLYTLLVGSDVTLLYNRGGGEIQTVNLAYVAAEDPPGTDTAGDSGTTTAGDSGTTTAGDAGTTTAGDAGTEVSGGDSVGDSGSDGSTAPASCSLQGLVRKGKKI